MGVRLRCCVVQEALRIVQADPDAVADVTAHTLVAMARAGAVHAAWSLHEGGGGAWLDAAPPTLRGRTRVLLLDALLRTVGRHPTARHRSLVQQAGKAGLATGTVGDARADDGVEWLPHALQLWQRMADVDDAVSWHSCG